MICVSFTSFQKMSTQHNWLRRKRFPTVVWFIFSLVVHSVCYSVVFCVWSLLIQCKRHVHENAKSNWKTKKCRTWINSSRLNGNLFEELSSMTTTFFPFDIFFLFYFAFFFSFNACFHLCVCARPTKNRSTKAKTNKRSFQITEWQWEVACEWIENKIAFCCQIMTAPKLFCYEKNSIDRELNWREWNRHSVEFKQYQWYDNMIFEHAGMIWLFHWSKYENHNSVFKFIITLTECKASKTEEKKPKS